jgi:hypothetical protein
MSDIIDGYSIDCDGTVPTPLTGVSVNAPEYELETLAQVCMKHYWVYYDGWECDFPVVMTFYSGEKEVAELSVSCEMTPSFGASLTRKL